MLRPRMARSLFRYHPTLGHQFIPGLRARIDHEGGGYLLRTNSSGFRCPHEFTPEKAPGVYRILLFGDSYTAGDGVSDSQRYGDLLESMLPGTEVYNFGLSGSGTDQQFLAWREYGAGLQCDLLLIGVLVENVRRVNSRYRPFRTQDDREIVLPKPYFERSDSGELELRHVPVPREPASGEDLPKRGLDRGGRLPWLRRAVNHWGPALKDRLQRLSRYQPLPEYDDPEGGAWRLLESILLRWIRETSTPVLISPIPLYQYVEKTASPRAYQARFASLHAPPRVLVHDPLPDFHAHPVNALRGFRFERDCHLTPAAHRVLAESLARRIEILRSESSAS